MPLIEAPAQVVQASAYAAHEEVMNRMNPDIFDRARMPWMGFLNKHKKERAFTRGKVVQKLQRDGGLELQLWLRKEVLEFNETFIDDELTWDPYRAHIGLEIVHADLEDRGFSIMPNAPRGKTLPKIPRAAGDILVDYFASQIDDMMDAWDVRQDELLLRDGTQSALAPVGLDGLLPLDNTVGTIGGKSRSDSLVRHVVKLDSTVGSAGTLERDLQQGVREAEENTRGFNANIDFIMAGDTWIDGYVDYAKANNLRFNAEADSATGLDIGIPDSRLRWNGIPIVRNPTFRRMDANGWFTGTPFGRRAYFLSSKTWELAYQRGKDKQFSAAVDPSDQRMSRLSTDGRYALICRFPAAQFVNTQAA